MVKLRELRKKAAEELRLCGNDSPIADVDYILKSLGFDKNDIILGDEIIELKQQERFDKAVARLKTGEPVQYIAGECEFMSLMFEVNQSTLIPRADTEVLVETVAQLCKDKCTVNILEIGSGSGCIAISLAHLLPNAKVVSLDISKSALAVATRNAKRNKVSDRVMFIEHNIMEGFPELEDIPDVVVSNPPYIPKADIDGLDKKVRDFEPTSALDGGEDGLDFYRFISKNAVLKKNGLLAFEVGIKQAEAVARLMEERFVDIKAIKDLSGIDRVVIGKFNPASDNEKPQDLSKKDQ